MKRPLKPIAMAISLGVLTACSSSSYIDQAQVKPQLPANWQVSPSSLATNEDWLAVIANEQLLQLLSQALNTNQSLIQLALEVEVQRQAVTVTGANFWPSLSSSLDTGVIGNNNDSSNSSTIGLNLNYELDIWGKLSDADRRTKLTLFAVEANYEQAKDQLIADVAKAYYKVATSAQLLDLFERRTENAKVNFDIIESGYLQGLNSALDVYLTQNEYHSEKSNLASQRSQYKEDIRALERLLGDYPKGALKVQAELPLLPQGISAGVPSELVKNKPSLQAAWYQLLAQDANVAYTQKQRYPSLSLRGSIGSSNAEFGELFNGDNAAWSVFGGLTAPIFNAGRLKAQTEQQKLKLKQQEQQYLDTLFSAFEQVENTLDLDASLQIQYQATLKAQDNATQAETLSFEQYQSGLVSYTTVLDAQTRSFVAQTSVINLKNQIINNRIALHLALGGSLQSAVSQEQTNAQ
ncbi:TolC family protein [Paraferrimonas sp. SM1919]|uniref:TolC family protein n=1 Tax=Paraferrimonas sp. SM1919 TaxID=2662263 RepID=UPI0013D14EE6|nr:TolC family protein [Paraferrimonas sp. SM1919]